MWDPSMFQYNNPVTPPTVKLPDPSLTVIKLQQKMMNTRRRDNNRSISIFGHVDSGKTCLTGSLIWFCSGLDNRSKDKMFRHVVENHNFGQFSQEKFKMGHLFSHVATRNWPRSEPDNIQHLSYHSHIFSESHHCTLFDTPGHRGFKYNFLRGLAQSDEVGILVVSAAKGEYEAGMFDPTSTTATSTKNEKSENKNETSSSSSLDSPGQTREYSLLAAAHGIKSLLVAVNKMDTVDYDQERYLHIKQQVSRMLKSCGFDLDRVKFVPVSSFSAQNIIEPPNDSKFSSWWRGGSNGNDVQTTTYGNDDINGLLHKNSSSAAAASSACSHATQQQQEEEEEDCPTLFEALESLRYPSDVEKQSKESKDLRIFVRHVDRILGIGTVVRGKVVQGVLKPGMLVCFTSSASRTALVAEKKLISQSVTRGFEVKSVEMFYESVSAARPGETVGFNIQGAGRRDIIRGSICGLSLSSKDRQVTTVSSFEAKLILLPRSSKREKPIKPGFQPTLAVHGTHCGCKIEYFSKLVKKDTNEVVESYPKTIDWNNSTLRHDCYLIARLKPVKEICVETYREVPQLGRISLHDNGRTIAVGVVTWCDYPATVRRWQRRRIVFAMKEFGQGRLSKYGLDVYRVFAFTVLFL